MTERINVVGNLAKDVIDGKEQFGGSAANIAIGLRGLGLDVGILSVLGKDSFGSSYRNYLKNMGIDTSMINNELDILPICEVFSRNNTNMDRRWSDNGCKTAMEQLIVRPEKLKGSLVHIVSCPPSLTMKFVMRDIGISYEPGPMLVYSGEYFNLELANRSIFIFLNNEEHKIVSGMGVGIRKDGYGYNDLKAMIITKGEHGSRLITMKKGRFIKQDIPSVKIPESEIVDYTGAGDNYKAGFLAAYVYGKTLVECANIGSEMGAASIKYQGGLLPIHETERIRLRYFG